MCVVSVGVILILILNSPCVAWGFQGLVPKHGRMSFLSSSFGAVIPSMLYTKALTFLHGIATVSEMFVNPMLRSLSRGQLVGPSVSTLRHRFTNVAINLVLRFIVLKSHMSR